MRRLEPLIARLVDDLLACIREATLEELRDLAAEVRRPRPHLPRNGAHGGPSAKRERGAGKLAPGFLGRSPRPEPRGSPSRAPSQTADDLRAARPMPAEITHPERLLAMVERAPMAPPRSRRRKMAPASRATDHAPRAESDGPASQIRPSATHVPRLREGETLVRVSNAGVVIRRARTG